MTPTDDQDDPRVTDDDQERRNIRDWLRAQPPAGALNVTGYAPTSTVQALREYMVAVEPNLKFDIDRFVEHTKGQSDHVLRVIVSDRGVSCGDLGIKTGILSSDQIVALAKGFLDDNLREKEKGFSREKVVLSVILTAIATWLLTVAAGAS